MRVLSFISDDLIFQNEATSLEDIYYFYEVQDLLLSMAPSAPGNTATMIWPSFSV